MLSSIQRIVDIAENRRLVVDIPPEIPAGKAEMTIVFAPLPPTIEPGARNFKNAINKARGIAKRSGATLTVETFLRWKQDDKAQEAARYRPHVQAEDIP
jgi:hypothetical protein